MAIILDELTQSKLKKKEKLPLLAEPSLRTAKPVVTPPPVIPPLQPSAPPMSTPSAGPILNSPGVQPIPPEAIQKIVSGLSTVSSPGNMLTQTFPQTLKSLEPIGPAVRKGASSLMQMNPLEGVKRSTETLKFIEDYKKQTGREPSTDEVLGFSKSYSQKESQKPLAQILEAPMTLGAASFGMAKPVQNITKLLAMMGISSVNPIGKIPVKTEIGEDVRDIANFITSGGIVHGASKIPQIRKAAISNEILSLVKSDLKNFEGKIFKGVKNPVWEKMDDNAKVSAIIEGARTKPELGDYISGLQRKAQTQRTRSLLFGEKGQAKIPFEEGPKKKAQIVPSVQIPKTPTQLEAEKLMKKKPIIPVPEVTKAPIVEPAEVKQGIVKAELGTITDVENLISEKAKQYGNRNAFLASDEYKKLYPEVEAIYKKSKEEYSLKATKAMEESGVKVGDRVVTLAQGFAGGESIKGTIIMRDRIPYIKLDSPQMTQHGYKKQVQWHKGWVLVQKEGQLPTDSLKAEARKYKTADEFVESKANQFHGTDVEFETFDLNKSKAFGQSKFGHWFTEGKEFAGMFGKNVKETFVDVKNPKIISKDQWDDIRGEHAKDGEWFKSWKNELIQQGYDGLKVEGKKEMLGSQSVESQPIIAAFNDSQVKTKSQLQSLWHEAQKGATPELTPEQAKVNFEKKWAEAYGNRPEKIEVLTDLEKRKRAKTPDIDKPLSPVKPPTEPPKTTFEQPEPEEPKLPKAFESILKPAQVKPTVNLETGVKKPKTPTQIEESKLLRRELQQEGVASREGFRAGKKEGVSQTKIKEQSRRMGIIAGLKDVMTRKVESATRKEELYLLKEDIKNRDVLRVKKELMQYAKENLPKEAQGRFLTSVANVKTGGQLSEAFRKVDKEVKNIEKKTILNTIKDTASKIAKSKRIDVESQEKVLEIFNEIDFVKRRPETMDKLRKLKKVFDRKAELGQDMEIPNRIWKKLEILVKKPADKINVAELKNIKGEMEDLANLGEKKLRIRESTYNMKKQRLTQEVINGAMAIENHPLIKPDPGSNLSKEETFKNVLSEIFNTSQKLGIVITPMDSFFDLQDGGAQTFDGPVFRTFKQSVDTDYQNVLRDSSADRKLVTDLVKQLKITQQDSEIMGVYAIKIQKGGLEKLPDVKQKIIDMAELNERTEKLYDLWRKISDKLKPQIAAVQRDVWNLPFEEVENYFSFVMDKDRMSDMEIYDRFGKVFNEKSLLEGDPYARPGKKVKFGATEKRVGGKFKADYDFIDVILNHIDNAYYMIHMSENLKMLQEMMNDPRVSASLGEVGSRYTKEWLDLLVKKGGRLGDQQLAGLDILRANYGLVRLGFNISTGLIQLTAIDDAAMILGAEAFKGLNDVILSRKDRMFVLDNMPEVKARAGDDPGYSDFSNIPILKEGQKLSYEHIKFFDRLAAIGTGLTAYRQNLRNRGIPFSYDSVDKQAVTYAQQKVRQTQASSLFKDIPPALRGGFSGNRSFDKFLFQFQTFMLNRWNNIRNYTFRAKIMGGRKRDPDNRNFMEAFWSIFYFMLAILSETAIRRGERKLEEKAVEYFTKGYIPEDKRRPTFTEDAVLNTAQTVPFVSQGISTVVYRGDVAPALDTVRGLAEGPYRIATSKTKEGKMRAALQTSTAIGGVTGIPGLGQVEKTGKMIINARTEDSVRELYKKALENNELVYDSDFREWIKNTDVKERKFTDRADKLAKELNLPIMRMRKSAATSGRREKTNVFKKIEEKTRDMDVNEFRKEIDKLIRRGELSKQGADKVTEHRVKRLLDEDRLEEELLLQGK